MNKQLKAILTIVAGTIGVGFLALPYSIYKFGTFAGIFVLVLAGFLTLITNLTYSDIITSDKGNRQVPGYTKKYLGFIPAHMITVVIITGSLGILLAYSLVAGRSLKLILSQLNINLSASFFGLMFAMCSLFVMRYGMQIIAKVSSWAVVILIIAMGMLICISIPKISLSNVSSINFSEFPLIFGVSIFALYSATSVPVVDEIIGYNKKKYRNVVIASTIISLLVYIIFGLILSLSFGNSLTSTLVDSFGGRYPFASILLSVLTLLATFTSFVLVANNVKEILIYDYQIPSKIAILLISSTLIWLLIFSVFDFETIVSLVGNFSLTLQSIAIFAIWFVSQKKKSLLFKIIISLGGVILIAGMLVQI